MDGSNLRRFAIVALIIIVDVVIIVVIRSSTVIGLQQADQVQIQVAVEGTLSSETTTLASQPPLLLIPSDQATFDNAAAVTLNWMYYRPLADNEYFDLRVWRDGDPPNGITWTKDMKLDLQDWLLYQKPGNFNWTVDVIQKQADGSGTPVSAAAATQHFTMSAIDMQVMDLPPGFSAHYYARLPFPNPTVITFGPDSALYALSISGDIARMTDEDGDGFAETVKAVYTDSSNTLNHAVGMAFYKNVLYVSDGGRISTVTDSNGDGTLDTIKPIVQGLPSQWYTYHSNNGIAFGPDGKLYVGVGSTTDHGPLRTRYEASILRMNPDGSDLETFATGFRNPYDLVFTPKGDLFTSDNSPDAVDATLPYLPPEEIDYVQQGKDYGFPTVFGSPPPGSTTAAPVVDLPTSAASSGITYDDEDQFPPEYRGLYLAQLGTGADASVAAGVHTGRDVLFIALTPDGHGSYSGSWKPFATFRNDLSAAYTPIDVTVGPDGALYIAEWLSSTVYRVTYSGSNVSLEETSTASEQGEAVYDNGSGDAPACASCHSLDATNNTTAPSLVGLAGRAGSRIPGMSAEDYVRQSIMTPDAFIVPGFSGGVMYPHYAQNLTQEQINDLITYVLSL